MEYFLMFLPPAASDQTSLLLVSVALIGCPALEVKGDIHNSGECLFMYQGVPCESEAQIGSRKVVASPSIRLLLFCLTCGAEKHPE